MTTLLAVEARRYLARRLTRVLIGVALLASAVAGLVVFVNAEGAEPPGPREREALRAAEIEACVASFRRGFETVEGRPPEIAAPTAAQARELCSQGEREADEYDRRLHLTDLWSDEGGDSIWAVTSVFLGIGALIGGASMVGAEWKAGTFTTLLTWEPRRTRVAVAKLAMAGVLAAAIAVVLQLALAGALLPTIALRGTTEGADAAWAGEAAAALGRSGALAGIGAVLGSGIAMIGRSTAAALGTAFAYLAVVEAVLRAWKPLQARWLIGENATIFLTARRFEGAPFDRPVAVATVTLVAYTLAVAAVATATLRRRDVAG